MVPRPSNNILFITDSEEFDPELVEILRDTQK